MSQAKAESLRTSLRPAKAGDEAGVIALISAVFAEYGDICEPEGFDSDLADLQASFAGGAFWVIPGISGEQGQVLGCVGVKPVSAQSVELKRLYLAAELRGLRLGRFLAEQVLAWARARGTARVELWSDVRFLEAHQLYEKLGFQGDERRRVLEDINQSVERYYSLDLTKTDLSKTDLSKTDLTRESEAPQ
jgi:putative acetyltransferase